MGKLAFGKNLKLWRKHRELTQQALADLVGTSKGFIAELEGGKKKFAQDTLERLAEALGTTPGILIEVSPEDAEAIERAREIIEAMRRADAA